MKKEHAIKKKTLAGTRNTAIKSFLTTPPSYLTLQPIHVLVLSLCFMGNIVLLHIIGRFGVPLGLQTVISAIAIIAALVVGYLVQRQ
ncbi:protein transport protein SEC61 subunit beta [Nematocida homosporus]|uniref:protein transport protein SEC61 subunit beta n=1 Tax=Nematocida homosporus TaxID=1912981 RepID=UPI00221F1A05|nr:protein transport protein SEC61 subunit beta [Nematocida homosporus]KAI5185857.1 protein transport protein SEC61 subunit beta [Nematocida homosporus]